MTAFQPSYEMIEEQGSSFQYREHDAYSDLIRWHYHEEYELHLLVSSKGKSFVGDYVGTFQPGCLILTGPNLPHNWISLTDIVDGTRDRVINFSPGFVQAFSAVVPEARSLENMLLEARYGIQFTQHISEQVAPLFSDIASQSGLVRFTTFMNLLAFLAQSQSYIRLSTRLYEETHDKQTLDRINRVVNYMTEHFTDNCKLEDVAEQLQLNPVVFSRFFHRATGHRFSDFLIQLRIGKACEYLENSDAPITNICYDVGFKNLSNFNRRFLKLKGMTPSDYRRNIALRDKRSTHHILM